MTFKSILTKGFHGVMFVPVLIAIGCSLLVLMGIVWILEIEEFATQLIDRQL